MGGEIRAGWKRRDTSMKADALFSMRALFD
jgi:hypothetical protein